MRTEFEILTDINRLYMDLSPENISWDGMRSPNQVREAAREIHQQLKKLFKELGREVDDYEVMQELRALRGRRSAKQTMIRSASEVINELEMRIARLEKQSSRDLNISDLAEIIARAISETYQVNVTALSSELEMKLHDFFLGFDEFYDDEDEYAEDGVYDLVFEVKKVNSELKYLDTIFMSVVVHYFGGSKEVDFRVEGQRGRYKIKRASSSRLA